MIIQVLAGRRTMTRKTFNDEERMYETKIHAEKKKEKKKKKKKKPPKRKAKKKKSENGKRERHVGCSGEDGKQRTTKRRRI